MKTNSTSIAFTPGFLHLLERFQIQTVMNEVVLVTFAVKNVGKTGIISCYFVIMYTRIELLHSKTRKIKSQNE